MNVICIFDLSNDGHHWFYNFSLMKELSKDNKVFYVTANLTEDKKNELNKESIEFIETRGFLQKNKMLINLYEEIATFRLLMFCRKNKGSSLYLIHFDRYILSFSFMKPFFKKVCNSIFLTVHWYPDRRFKQKILYRLSSEKKITIITHTEDIKKRITTEKSNNIKVINYPVSENSIINKNECIKKLGFDTMKNNLTLLYFGGTRYDKGIDILLQSLLYIKSNFNLIIAGKEEYFTKLYIEQQIKQISDKVNIIIELKYIDEEDVKYYFCISDALILPYRKIFSGESGIFTEAFNYGKVVIAPDIMHFSELISTYKNGLCYKCEDIYDLANSIDIAVENFPALKLSAEKACQLYKSTHSKRNFINGYVELLKGR